MPACHSRGTRDHPGADWLVNNFHLVEEQVRDIRVDLPPAFHRQLPKLTGGPFQGYARIFGMAWNLIAHTDSEFDATMLTRFLRAYQTKAPLTIGEIWAFPITLRIVLVENLRRAADGIVEYQAMQQNLQSRKDALQQDLYKKTEDMRTSIRKTIEEYVKDYNKQRTYAFIFAYDPSSYIYYRDTIYNITSDLLDGLNASYKKKN